MSATATPAADIRIEMRRGATAVHVAWPLAAAADCAAWLRELLR
jgi:transposase